MGGNVWVVLERERKSLQKVRYDCMLCVSYESVCMRMNVCGDINKTKAYLPSVVFSGATRIVRYWGIERMKNGRRFNEPCNLTLFAWMWGVGSPGTWLLGRYLVGTSFWKYRDAIKFNFERSNFINLVPRIVTYRIKSRSVSAVRTTRVVALPFMLPISLPEPGRIVLTRMMPSTTAQIVVVK